MGETNDKSPLDKLTQDLDLDNWWHDLLGYSEPVPHTGVDTELALNTIPRTEKTAAEAIKRKLGNRLSYTEGRNMWYIWDERIHTPCDGEGVAVKVVKILHTQISIALQILEEAFKYQAQLIKSTGGPDSDKKSEKKRKEYDSPKVLKYRSFRDRLGSASGQSAVVQVLKTECDVPSDYYDNDQKWFVMRDSVIDLDVWTHLIRSGNTSGLPVLKHDPDRPVTKYFDADFYSKPTPGPSAWDEFLKSSIDDDDARDYLQKVVGAAFMGESKLRTIINLKGPPGSGKSVFIGTLFKLAKEGAGYACMPDSKALTKVSGQNFEQDTMRGRRIVGVSEPDHRDPIDDDFLKKVTGDDWVETRTLNVKSSGWVPQCVIFAASNSNLRINTRDSAIVERVQIIEFPHSFRPDHPDPKYRPKEGLEDALMDDRSSILKWILKGIGEFIRSGKKLYPPESVVKLREQVITGGSAALRWLEDYKSAGLLIQEDYHEAQEPYYLTTSQAYKQFQLWKTENGERSQLTKTNFTEDLERRLGACIMDVDGVTLRIRGLRKTDRYVRIYENNDYTAAAAK